MIKYKVKDVATDFGVQNKKITEVLEKFCGVSKKAGTSLEENELNVIFDVLTAENKVDSFDKYFAKRNEAIENAEAQTTEVKEEKKPEAKEANAPKTNKTDKKPEKANNNQKSEKPAEQAQPKATGPALDMKTSSGAMASGDLPAPTSLAEAMERQQDALLAKLRKK